MNRFDKVDIAVDKADNLAAAEERATAIAGVFFGSDGFEIEQVAARPEQQIVAVTSASGREMAVQTGPLTFYVEFVARRAL